MYSQELETLLKKQKIKVGDRVRVITKRAMYEGILMPRIELGDPSSLVVKLDNGYNIGVKFEKGTKVKLVQKGREIKFKPSTLRLTRDHTKSTISILGCGGTITSRVEYTTGATFPAFSPSDLLESFPELREIANIEGRKVFDLLSEDMTPEHWKIIAQETVKEIKSGVNGVVLMHGTDTMHYTSAALSFMLQDLPVPVVMVGAQRSSDRGSSDNLVNLVCASLTASRSDIAEVSVCMHGSESDDFCYVHQGTKVRKLHTSRRDAFQSVNVLPYAKVWYDNRRIDYLRDDFQRRERRKINLDTKLNPNVALIQIYPGIKPEFIEKLTDFDGIVITGTGLGHVPTNPFNDKFTKSLIPALKNLIAANIPVVIAPQTVFGRINMNIYTAGRLLNAIGVIGNGCDWLPETALVKLMFVTAHTKELKKVREMMLTNYAGEISQRTEVEEFD